MDAGELPFWDHKSVCTSRCNVDETGCEMYPALVDHVDVTSPTPTNLLKVTDKGTMHVQVFLSNNNIQNQAFNCEN